MFLFQAAELFPPYNELVSISFAAETSSTNTEAFITIIIDDEDPTTSEVMSAMLSWYYSHNQNYTLSTVGVSQVKVNGKNILFFYVD